MKIDETIKTFLLKLHEWGAAACNIKIARKGTGILHITIRWQDRALGIEGQEKELNELLSKLDWKVGTYEDFLLLTSFTCSKPSGFIPEFARMYNIAGDKDKLLEVIDEILLTVLVDELGKGETI